MYDACVLHLNKEGTSPQLLNDIEMIEFLERGTIFYYQYNNNTKMLFSKARRILWSSRTTVKCEQKPGEGFQAIWRLG